MDKMEMRQIIRGRLFDLPQTDRDAESKQACQHLIETEEYQKSSVVMIFLPLPHEIDTTGVILDAWQKGKTVVVPKVSRQQRHMIPVEITSLETGFSEERGGFKNPTTGVPMPVEEIDLVLAPGMGFDAKGNRLGRAGGYYDRFFKSEGLQAAKCGFCFNLQIFDDIPTEDHDEPVDLLVSAAGVVCCDQGYI